MGATILSRVDREDIIEKVTIEPKEVEGVIYVDI